MVSGRLTQRRLPWAPFARWYGPILGDDGPTDGSGRWTNREYAHARVLGDLFGVSARTVQRWVTDGVPEPQADHMACRLGVHPSAIWSCWFSMLEPDLEMAA